MLEKILIIMKVMSWREEDRGKKWRRQKGRKRSSGSAKEECKGKRRKMERDKQRCQHVMSVRTSQIAQRACGEGSGPVRLIELVRLELCVNFVERLFGQEEANSAVLSLTFKYPGRCYSQSG